jgi:hypothetical protein
MDNQQNDQNRLLVATFIVATTVTILLSRESVAPNVGWVLAVVGIFLIGLMISSLFAFAFILAKGYELRYGSHKKNGVIDKYNYVLYNMAVKAYALVVFILFFIYAYGLLNENAKKGNFIAIIAIPILWILAIIAINYRSICQLMSAIRENFKK